jgi:hypothetical protein
MQRKLKVFWIDDKHEELEDIKFNASQAGLELVGFESLESGLKEIKLNNKDYDAVILDANFKEKDSSIVEDDWGRFAYDAYEEIKKLDKFFKPFVLTAYTKDPLFHKIFGKENIFLKNKPAEVEELFKTIKIWYNEQDEIKIRNKYKEVFDICGDDYLDSRIESHLMSLFKNEGDYQEVRKSIELIFLSFAKKELLPYEFVTPSFSHNPTSKFLQGYDSWSKQKRIEKGFEHLPGTWLPPAKSKQLQFMLDISQPENHAETIPNEGFSCDNKTNYKLQGTVNTLIDFILWVKFYFDSNPKKNNWKKIDFINGEISELIQKNDFGYISCEHNYRLWFHFSNCNNPNDLKLKDKVEFRIGKNKKGDMAIDVNKI